jgi:hypothetical protein
MGARMLEGDNDGADEDGKGEVGQGGGGGGSHMGRDGQEGCRRRRVSGIKYQEWKRRLIQ